MFHNTNIYSGQPCWHAFRRGVVQCKFLFKSENYAVLHQTCTVHVQRNNCTVVSKLNWRFTP